jgi:electron transfer flavoprotein alpha subunit
MKVLVFIEQRDGKIKSAAHEALTVGAKLAGSPANLAAVIIGSGVTALTSQLAGWGVDTVYAADDAALTLYNIQTYANGFEAAIKAFSPNVVLGIASPMGRDLFPRLAARMNGAMLTDLTSIEATGSGLSGTKPMYAGKCIADIASVDANITFATIRQNAFPAVKAGNGSATATPVTAAPGDGKIKAIEIRKGKSAKPDLTEASVIISGGRAMGNSDNFKILAECAEVIGATVGASRAAVDSGYASHDMQVGQTGKTVNPNLYIACGISGSIQHMAGMRSSKVIVAVNTDKDAPIFGIASYGIVGDLFQVVPLLTARFKALLK